MRQPLVGVVALSSCLLLRAKPNDPATGGTCADPDPNLEPAEEYECPKGYGAKDPFVPTGVCTDAATCTASCCNVVDPPSAAGTCADPDPALGLPQPWECRKSKGWTKKIGVAALACTSDAICDENCCNAFAGGTTPLPALTTTTVTAWDSSSGSSGNSLASESTRSLDKQDSMGSDKSSGSHASGSSGFNMPFWLWALLGLLLCCCCLMLLMMCCQKKKKKKPTPPKTPKHHEEHHKHHEAEPLLPPLAPLQPMQPQFVPVMASVPAPTTAVPISTFSQPMSFATGMPPLSGMPTAQAPMMTTPAYAGYPGYPGYPGVGGVV